MSLAANTLCMLRHISYLGLIQGDDMKMNGKIYFSWLCSVLLDSGRLQRNSCKQFQNVTISTSIIHTHKHSHKRKSGDADSYCSSKVKTKVFKTKYIKIKQVLHEVATERGTYKCYLYKMFTI